MSTDQRLDLGIMVMVSLACIGILYIIFYGGYQRDMARASCEAQGGVFFPYAEKCVRKEAVIPLPK